MTTSHSFAGRYADALMNTFGPPKLTLVRGEGAHVWDSEGVEYVDLLGGIAVNALGHAHPALVQAVTDQLSTLGHISNFFASEPQIELAERLLALVDAGPGKVFFTNSGTEAVEAGFKLTRRTGRTHVVVAEGGFHGRSMGALALTSKEAYRAPFEPLPGHVTFVPFGDAEALTAAVTDETAAVLLEPIQGEAGVVVPPADYLAEARRITTEHGALLWLDEIQSGMGRTGLWLEHHRSRGHARMSSRWRRAWRAASRSARASRWAVPPTCCSRATTGRRSAATQSPAPPRSPSCARSRPRACSSGSPWSGRSSATGCSPTRGSVRYAAKVS